MPKFLKYLIFGSLLANSTLSSATPEPDLKETKSIESSIDVLAKQTSIRTYLDFYKKTDELDKAKKVLPPERDVDFESNISPAQMGLLQNALSLVGKVKYFWGGKADKIGWDDDWGKIKTVSAKGSKTTGQSTQYGLDCSGYVSWAFANTNGEMETTKNDLGTNTKVQYKNSEGISRENVQIGDLAFNKNLSHVGIVVGKTKNGEFLVAHCASSKGVVVTKESFGNGDVCKFTNFRRPSEKVLFAPQKNGVDLSQSHLFNQL